MAKIDFSKRAAGSIVSKVVEIAEPITKAGKYTFKVVKAVPIDSRTNPDGSEKERLPIYVDATPEIYLVLNDVISGKIHVTRMTLAAYAKLSSFTAADIKDNKLEADERDGYALYKDAKGNLNRIPAQEGEDGYEAVLNIFSRFTTALGLPEGTSPEETESFVGRHFKGELKEDRYTAHSGEEKDRLKLAPSFYPVTDAELAEMLELMGAGQAFE